MAKSIKPIPEGYHAVTPYLIQRDAKRALEYYKKAFGAEIRMSMPSPDGRVMHAEIKIGDSMIFLCDEFPERSPETKSPQSAGCVTSTIFLYVRTWTPSSRRRGGGSESHHARERHVWGDRFGTVADPFGHHWASPPARKNSRRRKSRNARRSGKSRWPEAIATRVSPRLTECEVLQAVRSQGFQGVAFPPGPDAPPRSASASVLFARTAVDERPPPCRLGPPRDRGGPG